jgi:hypothetical protein
VGVKVTKMAQFDPGATVEHVDDTLKSPVLVMLVMSSDAFP